MSVLNWFAAHSLIILLLAGTLFTFFWLVRFQEKLGIKPYAAAPLALLHTAVGVFCVCAFAALEALDIRAFGNMSLFGGVFFMPVLYLVLSKLLHRPVQEVFDIFTICMLFTLMCARINCLTAGCCTGKQIPGTVIHWPTREMEIIFYLVCLVIFGRHIWKAKINGKIYPEYMMAYGVFRFIIEWFRTTDSPYLFHKAHIWAVLSFCLGLAAYLELQTKEKKRRRKGR